ncbi:alpha/beta fold hydrolase [Rhizobium laguerreae]|uniref:alpha/beta fold hydrolase n=1 Tax=Rhizobium laguerreae TaxID=1076926 RepID=UPI00103DDFD3|nr:alpha/beta hydrolase [Rhizobium laguerreae]TBX97271.1 alpha/beta hydrolase [Rhizobium laguerreae]
MFIRIRDIELFASVEGDENSPLMICLHGGRGTENHVGEFEIFRRFSDRFRVVAYDQRGCGKSPLGEDISSEIMVADLEEVRLQMGGDRPAVIIGFSYGGMIAMLHALHYPDAVSHLITIGSPLSHEFEELALAEFDRRHSIDAPAASRTMIERQLRHGFESELQWRIVKFAMRGLYRPGISPNEALASALDPASTINIEAHKRLWMGSSYDIRPQLGELKSKLLAISGELDWLVPPSNADELLAIQPSARYLVVPGVGHPAHHAARDIVLHEIRDFLVFVSNRGKFSGTHVQHFEFGRREI